MELRQTPRAESGKRIKRKAFCSHGFASAPMSASSLVCVEAVGVKEEDVCKFCALLSETVDIWFEVWYKGSGEERR